VDGRVITIGRMVHREDQGVMVRAEVGSGAERLHPGQFVQVQLSLTEPGGALRVPSAALVRRDGQTYVFVVSGAGLQAVPVEVLAEEHGGVVIRGNLKAGVRVVSSGVASVKAAWQKLGE
jgi:multidrug efflux pump subunit AcrA (membrane-fusion protein)